MDDWINIIYNQWNITLSIHYITRIYCELNGLLIEYIARSHVNPNKVVACDKMSSIKQKCHRCYHINIIVSGYLSCNWQDRLPINGTKMSSMGFSSFLNHDTSNTPNLSNPNVNLGLESQTKCDEMFSDPESDHTFSHFLVT